jgi:hypothetical protein
MNFLHDQVKISHLSSSFHAVLEQIVCTCSFDRKAKEFYFDIEVYIQLYSLRRQADFTKIQSPTSLEYGPFLRVNQIQKKY